MAWRAWLPDEPPRRLTALLLGAGLACAATLVRVVLGGPLAQELPFITYFPALIVAAAFGGYAGGLTCLLVATAAAVVLFLPDAPLRAWAIGSFWIAGGLIVAVAAALADSVRQLRRGRAEVARARAELQTLVSELAHRNRNALTVVMSIVSQSAQGASSAAEAARIANDRLSALARAQEVVVQSDGQAAELHPIVERSLAPFDLARFDVAPSPAVEVEPDVAVTLGLLLHEMATNAVKHGALAVRRGRVSIGWTTEVEAARLTWRETGGPAVAAPKHEGFGGRLFAAAFTSQGGEARRRFAAEGVVCELRIPITARAPAPQPAAHAASSGSTETALA